MPRPRMIDDVMDDVLTDNSANENVVNAGAETAGTDANGVDTNAVDDGAGDKKPRGGKRLKVADGTLGLLPEPVKAEIPKRGGGRGRTVSAQTLKAIEMVKASPGESFLIGRYAAAAVAEGEWKKNGISFSSAAVTITNVDGDEVTVYDRYATYTPGTEVTD